MKKTFALAALGALLAAPALGADLPRRTAPASPAIAAIPAFAWTGFYAGLNAGYGFGNFTGAVGKQYKDPAGFTGGVQIGYNHQVGQMVYGLETDLNYANLRGNNNALGVAGSKNTVDYFGTVRGRIGYSVDRFLPYLTAGFAYGGSTVSVPGLAKSTPTHVGWTAGVGVEYAITNNLTARVEGLYVDLNDQRVLGGANKSGSEFGVVRAGINAKF
ncbi:COG3637 Opacity protein and related surface antigens [Rhabdaerophilaceae bacterium]